MLWTTSQHLQGPGGICLIRNPLPEPVGPRRSLAGVTLQVARGIVAVCLLSGLTANSASGANPPVTAVAFSPDGNRVVVGSQAGIEIRDWPQLTRQQTLTAEFPNVHELAFSPDARVLAVGGGAPAESGTIQLFAWPNADTIAVHAAHEDAVYSLDWNAESTKLAVASLDRQVTHWLWEPLELRLGRRYTGHSRGVTSVCILPEPEILVSAGIDQSLRVWDMNTGELIRTLANHTRPVHDLAVRPDTGGLPMIASVSDDRTVRFWQPTIGRMVRFIRLESVPLKVVWRIGVPEVVVAADDGSLHVIEVETAEVTEEIKVFPTWASSLAIHPLGREVVVGGSHGQLARVTLHDDAPAEVDLNRNH